MNNTISLENKAKIVGVLSGVFGRMGSVVSYQDILSASEKDLGAPKTLKGKTLVIEANCNLCKSYKYTKEIGEVNLVHNGKTWMFLGARRAKCFPGRSTGGVRLVH